jgi:hypothetical protein
MYESFVFVGNGISIAYSGTLLYPLFEQKMQIAHDVPYWVGNFSNPISSRDPAVSSHIQVSEICFLVM